MGGGEETVQAVREDPEAAQGVQIEIPNRGGARGVLRSGQRCVERVERVGEGGSVDSEARTRPKCVETPPIRAERMSRLSRLDGEWCVKIRRRWRWLL